MRAKLSKLPGLQEQEAYTLLQSTLKAATLDGLKKSYELKTFALAFNTALVNGESMELTSMVAYLTPDENRLLEMPDDISSSLSAVDRYEAPVSNYITQKQEL